MTYLSGRNMYRSLLIISLVILLIFSFVTIAYLCHWTGGTKKMANQGTIDDRTSRNNDPWNKHAVDTAATILQTGDLVLRDGIDVTSDLLRQMNQTDKTYSHCGLVVVENGYPFVYHSIGGEDNPDARMRRDSASFFFSPYNNFRFGIARYAISDAVKERVKKIIWTSYKQHIRFDMDFDLKTDDKLYCAEFVYKTMNKATGDNQFILPTKVMGYTFVGTDNLFVNPHTRMIWQVKFK